MPELTLLLRQIEKEQLSQLFFEHVEPAQLRSLAKSRLGIDLDIVADGRVGTDVAMALIEECHRQHIVEKLLALATTEFPPAEPLQSWILALSIPSDQVPADSPLQRLLSFKNPTQDFYVFCELARGKGKHVCRVEIDGQPEGTGLLVGADQVLTAHHVVQKLIKNGHPVADAFKRLVFRFDYFRFQDRTISGGMTVAATENWLGPHLPPHPKDGTTLDPGEPPYFREHLDYALLSLARRIGDEPMRPEGGETRGWTEIDDDEALVPLVPNLPIFIGHHPDGIPLQSTIGTVATCNTSRTRVRYNANVTHGSSGAPCFNNDFRVVAMHHSRINGHPLNQGIPIVPIKKHILERGAYFAAPDDGFVPVWKLADESPVIGRDDFQRVVWDSKSSVNDQVIMTVVGAAGMGKTYCLEILRAQLGGTNRVVAYDFASLHSKSLMATLEQLCDDLAIPMTGMPEVPDDRQRARWANTDLPSWFATAFEAKFSQGDADQNTVWIAIDNFEKYEFIDEETRDFFISLMQSSVRYGRLRWLLLGRPPNAAIVDQRLIEVIALQSLTREQAQTYLQRYCANLGVTVKAERITALVDFVFDASTGAGNDAAELMRQVTYLKQLQRTLGP